MASERICRPGASMSPHSHERSRDSEKREKDEGELNILPPLAPPFFFICLIDSIIIFMLDCSLVRASGRMDGRPAGLRSKFAWTRRGHQVTLVASVRSREGGGGFSSLFILAGNRAHGRASRWKDNLNACTSNDPKARDRRRGERSDLLFARPCFSPS